MPYPYYQYPTYNQMYYQQMQQNNQQSNQIQNGGFVMVKDINEAMRYPVAPGNSVTFKNENQPYIYTKTLGFSQLDQPIFEVFKLIKEEPEKPSEPEIVSDMPLVEYLTVEDADQIRQDVSSLRSEIDFLRETIEIYTQEDKDEK